MKVEDIQDNIIELERELLDLKTIQGVIKSAQGYSISYQHNDSSQAGQLNQVLQLNFADGSGDILCYCAGSSFAVPLKPVGNSQKVYFYMLFDGQMITFYSNREILSVVRL